MPEDENRSAVYSTQFGGSKNFQPQQKLHTYRYTIVKYTGVLVFV